MFWMLMAAAVQQPVMIKDSLVVRERDYPTRMIENGDEGVVTMHLSVTADGRVSACKVSETSGSEELDALTCSIASRRARFMAARDASGSAVAGDYWTAVTWGTSKNIPPISIPMDLGVKTLPANYRQPAQMHVLFGADGKPTGCDTALSSGSAAADRAVCAAIRQQASIAPPTSGSAEPAVATRTYIATLTTHPSNP